MAKKLKIQVMVDQSIYDSLVDFSKVTKQSISSVVADYLVMAQPTIDRMTDSLRGFAALTDKQKASFVSGLEQAEVVAKDQVQEALILLNSTLLNHDHRQMQLGVLASSENTQLQQPAAPATNRGASSSSKKPLKPKPSKASKAI
mgnify:CR=1 FL=1